MGVKRYEWNEEHWARRTPLLPDKVGDPGRTGLDNRLFVNGCSWVLHSGAYWCDLPERRAPVAEHRRKITPRAACSHGSSFARPALVDIKRSIQRVNRVSPKIGILNP